MKYAPCVACPVRRVGACLVVAFPVFADTVQRGENEMDEATFQNKLAELMGEISSLPQVEQDKLTTLAQKTQDRHIKLTKTVSDLQESLDYLRLSIKYLVFDLEATRRENAYLRKMLEEKHTDADEADDDIEQV
jgi:predicted  nucleic acid-binding Zn-ribbon protein